MMQGQKYFLRLLVTWILTTLPAKFKTMKFRKAMEKPEDHWSCIAHLSAEDMLKSAVIEEKKFKHSPWARADNPLWPKFWFQQEGLISMVICCKFKKNPFNLLTLYTSFHDLINGYAAGQGQTTPGDKILMSIETSCHFGHLLQV